MPQPHTFASNETKLTNIELHRVVRNLIESNTAASTTMIMLSKLAFADPKIPEILRVAGLLIWQ